MHNKKETKEMDCAYAQRRLAAKNSYQRKNRGKEKKEEDPDNWIVPQVTGVSGPATADSFVAVLID